MKGQRFINKGIGLARLSLHHVRRVLPLPWPKITRLHQHRPRKVRLPIAAPFKLTNPPRITVVTPSFGQNRFIGRTLDSVLDQNYPDLEFVVQDGGSRDGTLATLEHYGDRLARWRSEPDAGQGDAINRGFADTRGDIMAWLNSDDLFMPGALATVATYFDAHPETDVLYGDRIIIDERDREVGRWLLPPHDPEVLRWADWVPQETLFWRRSAWDRVGGQIDATFQFALDWDLLLRFQEAGLRIDHIPYFLGAFRLHAQQKTTAQMSDLGVREMARVRRRTLGREVTEAEVHAAVTPYIMRHWRVDLTWRANRLLRRA